MDKRLLLSSGQYPSIGLQKSRAVTSSAPFTARLPGMGIPAKFRCCWQKVSDPWKAEKVIYEGFSLVSR